MNQGHYASLKDIKEKLIYLNKRAKEMLDRGQVGASKLDALEAMIEVANIDYWLTDKGL